MMIHTIQLDFFYDQHVGYYSITLKVDGPHYMGMNTNVLWDCVRAKRSFTQFVPTQSTHPQVAVSKILILDLNIELRVYCATCLDELRCSALWIITLKRDHCGELPVSK